jgi:hypothetical protein
LLLLEAASFVTAALIHFGLLVRGYEHWKAGTAESVIATVLLAGLVLTFVRRGWTREVGLGAQAFALVGTRVGVFTIIVGVCPRTVPDIIYHVAIVAVLAYGLLVASRTAAKTAR